MTKRPVRLVLQSVATRGAGLVAAFVTTIVIARSWGPDGLAAYATGAAYGAFVTLGADLGLNTAALRWFVLDGPDATLLSRLFKQKWLLFVLAMPVGLLALSQVSQLPKPLLVPAGLFMLSGAIAAMAGPSAALLRSAQRMEWELAGITSERIVGVAVLASLAGLGAPLWSAGAAASISGFVLIVCLWHLAQSLTVAPGANMAPRRLREALPYAGALAFETVAFRFDAAILPRFDSAVAVGAYSGAYRVVFLVAAISSAVQSVLLPRWVSTIGEPRGARELVAAVAFPLAGIIGVLTVGLAPLLPALLGSGFRGGPELLETLSISVAVVPMYYVVSTALVADGATRIFLVGWAVAGIFNLVANLVYLPSHGVRGAAVTTVLTDLLLLGVWAVGAVARKSLPAWTLAWALLWLVPVVALAF